MAYQGILYMTYITNYVTLTFLAHEKQVIWIHFLFFITQISTVRSAIPPTDVIGPRCGIGLWGSLKVSQYRRVKYGHILTIVIYPKVSSKGRHFADFFVIEVN